MTRPLSAALFALALAACGSPPVRYHTLLPPDEAPARGAPAAFLVEVLPVGIPAALDQPQIAIRRGEAGVVLLDGDRWAGPLDEELRRALSAGIGRRLGARDAAGLPRPPDRPVLQVKVEIRRLDAWPGRKIVLDADWTLVYANARRLGGARIEEPAPGALPELTQAAQRAVAALAEKIAVEAVGLRQ
ncbi:MAG: PqiC family protein [Candidatus Accumulibacter sp.]|jgi:uncharacterized lipoprotein YmbA|nr:PqiC family protein [Accumulibacter sp.]